FFLLEPVILSSTRHTLVFFKRSVYALGLLFPSEKVLESWTFSTFKDPLVKGLNHFPISHILSSILIMYLSYHPQQDLSRRIVSPKSLILKGF
ncbi:MAG: hypothetical protein MKZ82_07320, partial [Gammaproteobacteria bacterium]|nr:hypothetical protein [Gammaproteobacteria bacterium]